MRVWVLFAAWGVSAGLSFGEEACAVNVLTGKKVLAFERGSEAFRIKVLGK